MSVHSLFTAYWSGATSASFAPSFYGVAGDRLGALYQLAAASGMRIGELAGLEWPDVHLDGGCLTVRRSKTATGRRRVVLDPATIAVLRAHPSGRQPKGGQPLPGPAVSSLLADEPASGPEGRRRAREQGDASSVLKCRRSVQYASVTCADARISRLTWPIQSHHVSARLGVSH
jgi:integrase